MPISKVKLRELTQKALNQAGDETSGVRTKITYVQVIVGVSDPSTDSQILNETPTPDVLAALVKLTAAERDWFPGDVNTQKCIIAFNDLKITPKLDDYLLIAGDRWDVKKLTLLPGTPVHILFIQEP